MRKKTLRRLALLILVIAVVVVITTVFSSCIESKGAELTSDITRYCEEVGMEYKVAPELLEAIIEYEVIQDHQVGIMKLDPIGQDPRMHEFGIEEIESDYNSILIGTNYLLDLFQEVGDDPYLVLTSYFGQDGKYIWNILKRSEELERIHGK